MILHKGEYIMVEEIKVNIVKSGPQGAKGDQGDSGPQGPQGPQGEPGEGGPHDNAMHTEEFIYYNDGINVRLNEESQLKFQSDGNPDIKIYNDSVGFRVEKDGGDSNMIVYNAGDIGNQSATFVVLGRFDGNPVIGFFKTGDQGGGQEEDLLIEHYTPNGGTMRLISGGDINISCGGKLILDADVQFNGPIDSNVQLNDNFQFEIGNYSLLAFRSGSPGDPTIDIRRNGDEIEINGSNGHGALTQLQLNPENNGRTKIVLNSDGDSGQASLVLEQNSDDGSANIYQTGPNALGLTVSNNQQLALQSDSDRLILFGANGVEVNSNLKVDHIETSEFFNGGKFNIVRLSETSIDCNSGGVEVTFNILDSVQGGWNYDNMYRIKSIAMKINNEITLDASSNVTIRMYGGENTDQDFVSGFSLNADTAAYELPDFYNKGSFSNIGLYSDNGNFTGGNVDVYAVVEYIK